MLMNVVQNIHDKNEKNYSSNFFKGAQKEGHSFLEER